MTTNNQRIPCRFVLCAFAALVLATLSPVPAAHGQSKCTVSFGQHLATLDRPLAFAGASIATCLAPDSIEALSKRTVASGSLRKEGTQETRSFTTCEGFDKAQEDGFEDPGKKAAYTVPEVFHATCGFLKDLPGAAGPQSSHLPAVLDRAFFLAAPAKFFGDPGGDEDEDTPLSKFVAGGQVKVVRDGAQAIFLEMKLDGELWIIEIRAIGRSDVNGDGLQDAFLLVRAQQVDGTGLWYGGEWVTRRAKDGPVAILNP
jgi:hypothetical protein